MKDLKKPPMFLITITIILVIVAIAIIIINLIEGAIALLQTPGALTGLLVLSGAILFVALVIIAARG